MAPVFWTRNRVDGTANLACAHREWYLVRSWQMWTIPSRKKRKCARATSRPARWPTRRCTGTRAVCCSRPIMPAHAKTSRSASPLISSSRRGPSRLLSTIATSRRRSRHRTPVPAAAAPARPVRFQGARVRPGSRELDGSGRLRRQRGRHHVAEVLHVGSQRFVLVYGSRWRVRPCAFSCRTFDGKRRKSCVLMSIQSAFSAPGSA